MTDYIYLDHPSRGSLYPLSRTEEPPKSLHARIGAPVIEPRCLKGPRHRIGKGQDRHQSWVPMLQRVFPKPFTPPLALKSRLPPSDQLPIEEIYHHLGCRSYPLPTRERQIGKKPVVAFETSLCITTDLTLLGVAQQ